MPERIRIGQLPIDGVDLEGALSAIGDLIDAKQGGTVFTPNVDHVVVGELDEEFRRVYQRVSLSLLDGMPLLWAARLLGKPVPAKVSGSDLVMPLFRRAAERGWRVFLLGAGPGVAEEAAARLKAELPSLQIAGTDSPRVKLDGDRREWAAIAERVAQTAPDLVMVAFGAPKQEIFSDEVRAVLKPGVLVCVGASLDFIAGTVQRAPVWMSRAGLEWLYRLACEPRRLAGRYLLRDPKFAVIFLRQWINQGLGRGA